jgi:Uma2 family endonuclease
MDAQNEDWLPRHRLTVDDYYRMGEIGVLAPDARTELINGEIIDMPPPGSRHAAAVAYLSHALMAAVDGSALVSVRSPLRLSRMNEPQPDLMILAARTDFYSKAHPGPADTQLVAEVSESSLRYDRQIKLPLYAEHHVPEFWLIDLTAKELIRCRVPNDTRYDEVLVFGPAQLNEPLATLSRWKVDLTRLFSLET